MFSSHSCRHVSTSDADAEGSFELFTFLFSISFFKICPINIFVNINFYSMFLFVFIWTHISLPLLIAGKMYQAPETFNKQLPQIIKALNPTSY